MIYEHDYTNPYLSYLPEQLQDFIQELICEEEDCAIHGLTEHMEAVREHRNQATDALLTIAGVWA